MISSNDKNRAIALNIVILPSVDVKKEAIKQSENLTKKFASEFTLNTKNFRPHITIYQGYFPYKNLDSLKKTLLKFSKESKKFSVFMSDFWISPGRFVWWNAKKSKEIMEFHRQILKLANPLREGLIAPPALEQLEELGEKERRNVLKTGAIYHGELYVPHVTLTRLKNEKDRNGAMKTLGETETIDFQVTKLIVANLGEHGTISNIIEEFEIKD